MMDALNTLDTVRATLVKRNKQYGDVETSFERIATVWTLILAGKTEVTPADVALMMAGLKLCRLIDQPDHEDSQIDLIGYAALISEVTNG